MCFSEEIDWAAFGAVMTGVGAIATAIMVYFTYKTLKSQHTQFETSRNDSKERDFKTSSVELVLSYEKRFDELEKKRAAIARRLLQMKPFGGNNDFDYDSIISIEDVYDFFEVIAYYVKEKYIKSDIAYIYFDHWFTNYYGIYKYLDIPTITGHETSVWENLPYLEKELNKIESSKIDSVVRILTTDDMIAFLKAEGHQ